MDSLWQAIENGIGAATGRVFRADRRGGLSGGCINQAFAVEGDGRRYFVKLNDAAYASMFEAEAAGLAAIRGTDSVRAPEPVSSGVADGHCWLVTEHIQFSSANSSTAELLGQQLAQMHRCQAPQYGWHRDNTIGATAQHNQWTDNWVGFLREKRLGFQLELAAANHAPAGLLDRGARLLHHLEEFFAGSTPAASLLHGDLWGGNWGADEAAQPVIFDPAVYFGDREADLAMTELFGGFDQRFYAAYNAAWPLDPGYQSRRLLYNLYHVLNHFNLFGGGYAAQAAAMVDRLLADASA